MAEETISWQGGRLEKEFQGNGRIILQIESSPTTGAKQRGPADSEVDSDNPVRRAQTPHISEMTWFFPSNAHGEKAIALDPDHCAQLGVHSIPISSMGVAIVKQNGIS